MATIKFAIDSRRPLKNGLYPLVFRITLDRKSFQIQSGAHIQNEDFDNDNQQITNDPKLNIELQKKLLDYKKLILDYLASSSYPTVDGLKNTLSNKVLSVITIKDFWLREIDRLKCSNQAGNARVYEHSLSAIDKILNLNVPFHDLSLFDLLRLETAFQQKGIKINSISLYMRTFRALCNKAIYMDIVGIDWYPFRKYKIKKEHTTPRVLNEEGIKNFFALDIPKNSPKYKYWCIGKLIFMLRGINIIDLLCLSKENIKQERLIYRRAKTGKIYSIALTPEIREILNQFNPKTTLLEILSQDDLNSPRKILIIKQKIKIINKHLAYFSQLIHANEKITTYVFRYSYANLAKKLGYSKDLIAEALGHEYGNKTTGIYLEQFDLEVLDNMNQAIIQRVNTNKTA